jgi:predicted nucleic acid-binding Zn ribbon protein
MIKNIVYIEKNGSIDLDLDNSELLAARADINTESQDLLNNELGGIAGKEENKEKTDLKRTGWKEARRATDVKHKCPVCGTIYWGRPNKTYCGTPCKEVAKKRRSRKKKRDIRDFKPHRGKAGEVYFMYKDKGTNKITFIPAFYADTRERAKQYIEKICPEDKRDDYIQQVNEVIRK